MLGKIPVLPICPDHSLQCFQTAVFLAKPDLRLTEPTVFSLFPSYLRIALLIQLKVTVDANNHQSA